VKTVIAIMPKIGAVGLAAKLSSPPPPLAGKTAAPSFSLLLQQAKPTSSESLGGDISSSRGLAREGYSPVGSPPKRETKLFDSKSSDSKTPEVKTNDPQGRSSTASQTPSPGLDLLDKPVPLPPVPPVVLCWSTGAAGLTPDTLTVRVAPNDEAPSASVSDADTTLQPTPVVIQPMLSQSLSGNAGVNSSTMTAFITGMKDGKTMHSSALGEDKTTNSDAPGGSTLWPTFSGDAEKEETQTGVTALGSATPGNVNTKEAGTAARLISNLAGVPVSDSATQFGNTLMPSRPPRNESRAAAEIADGVSKAKSATFEPVQVEAPPSLVPVGLVTTIPSPESGKTDSGSTKVTRDKPATDRSRVSGTPDSLGTTGKNAEVTKGEKAEAGKDNMSSFGSAPATKQSTDSTQASAVDIRPSFSNAGTQPSLITGEGKSASDASSPGASTQQPSYLGRNPTEVAETPRPIETASIFPTSPVQSAKLIERIGEAELRIGMRSGEFGGVDIRTSMVRNQFTAEISVERGELGRVMTAELSGLQSRLAEQGVPVASITVQNHAGTSTTASDQQTPRDRQQQYASNLLSERAEGPMPALSAFEGTAPASRLDIHM
jgi:flagellar hook-length control protein FliK